VFGIVKQNQGFINVYSEPGFGTTFTVYLPRHRGGSLPTRQEAAPAPAPVGRERILLVEDEPAIMNLAAMILAKQATRSCSRRLPRRPSASPRSMPAT